MFKTKMTELLNIEYPIMQVDLILYRIDRNTRWSP